MHNFNNERIRRFWVEELELYLRQYPQQHGVLTSRLPQHPPFVDESQSPPTLQNDPEQQLIKFIRRVYLLSGIFIAISVFQWMLISQFLVITFKYEVVGLMFLLIGFIALVLLNAFVKFPRGFRFNCILIWAFIECSTLGIILVLPSHHYMFLLLVLVLSSMLLMGCYAFGAWLPKIVLIGEICVCLSLIIFMVIALITMSLYFVTGNKLFYSLYFGIVLAGMIPVVVYHAQTVHGRLYELPFGEHVYSASTVYLHFILLFSCAFFLIHEMLFPPAVEDCHTVTR